MAALRNKEQKYSIHEIDRMRAAIATAIQSPGLYNDADRAAAIEDRLRTYMQNGTTPEELEANAMEKAKQRMEALIFYANKGFCK